MGATGYDVSGKLLFNFFCELTVKTYFPTQRLVGEGVEVWMWGKTTGAHTTCFPGELSHWD